MSAMRTTVRRFGTVTTFEAIKSTEDRVPKAEWKDELLLSLRYPVLSTFLVRAAQRQQRDFGQAAVAHGQNDRAEAARDVNLRLAAAAETPQDAAAHAPRGRALRAPSDLPAVRVPGEHEVHARARGAAQNHGVVRQKQLHLVGGGAGERQREVFEADHRVLHAREPEGGAAVFEAEALVVEHPYAREREEVRDEV